MATKRFDDIQAYVVRKLTKPESYKDVFHQHCNGEPLPSLVELNEIINLCRAIFFPGHFGYSHITEQTISYHTGVNIERLYNKLSEQIFAGLCFDKLNEATHEYAEELCAQFISRLPELRYKLGTDVVATYEGDPAATNYGEIISCYPVIRALSNYRIAHELFLLKIPLIPRIITEMAHSETGIDIHPAATIGESFTIDHGTGVVIGATSIIGKHVKLYQGVTLGAKSFPLDAQGNPIKGIERHPILEDEVIVYSNSTILGRITIGRGAVIGGNVWVTENVPAGAKITQKNTKHYFPHT